VLSESSGQSVVQPPFHRESPYDVLVVGGGINGAGIAADAAGRGLAVALLEANDLASATSSWSSKLIHGGLRYLEHYEFRLVREALGEREVLLRTAPHLVTPLRFRMPHQARLRPAWMIRAGLFLYDHLNRRTSLPGSRRIRFGADSPLGPEFKTGFEYSDCRVDDSRLVVVNALQARKHGATVLPRHRVVHAKRVAGDWQVAVERSDGARLLLHARALVNAAGPWVREVLDGISGSTTQRTVRLVKGSHIVVPALHDGDEAYILQHDDGRIVFVLPYLEQFSLIGTTDVDYSGDPAAASIEPVELDYLLGIARQYFRCHRQPADVIWSYSGVRPLLQGERADEAQAAASVSRDYHFEREDDGSGRAPLLSVFGGKLTTYRKLAEAAVDALADFFPAIGPAWTSTATLPGGEAIGSPGAYASALAARYPTLSASQTRRIAGSYGCLAERWLAAAAGPAEFGPLFRSEVDYLVRDEWAQTADDILWRRSKAAVALTASERSALRDRLNAYLATIGAGEVPALAQRTGQVG